MYVMINFIVTYGLEILGACWLLFREAAIYILFGLLVGGLLKVFLSPSYVAAHLGQGRFSSVFKAALLGIPIPLCSCGVLPAAASLKKQGANNGATTAFLISTPESGVDSISITWALLDPIMTVARPLAAFLSAMVAGVAENFFNPPMARPVREESGLIWLPNINDKALDEPIAPRKGVIAKLFEAIHHAGSELWSELVGWFFMGILLAGVVTALVPAEMISQYLGGGFSSMLLMLLFGIPLYICATASTPIAAAFILKGMSPGAALVFLLVGPATNTASLSVLIGLLGKRATALYLFSISVVSVLCGLAVDAVYALSAVSASTVVGQSFEVVPDWLEIGAAVLLLILSGPPLFRSLNRLVSRKKDEGCGCSSGSCLG